MEKLTKLTSNLIILFYLKPRIKIANAINSILENEIKRDRNKMLLFLISILISTIILPIIIVYNKYPLSYRLKWAALYLLFFSFTILFTSAYYDAILRFKKKFHIINEKAPLNLEFKQQTNFTNLVKNLLFKNAFACDAKDLMKVLSNQSPSNRISITYVGANGRLSYHNLFFTFHYLLKNGINNLTSLEKKELLTYFSTHFKKGNKSINPKTLNQNYNDWLKYKFHKSFENEFLKEFVNYKQSVKD